MKPKRAISGYVLLVGIMGLSIVGGILAFQLFAAATKSQVSTEQATLIKPLDGTINQKAVDNLQKRIIFSNSELNTVVSTAVLTVTPTPTVSTGGNIEVAPNSGNSSASATPQ